MDQQHTGLTVLCDNSSTRE